MTFDLVLTGVVIFAACAFTGWMIWRWGLGERTWKVWCPVHKKAAKILAIQREAEFVPGCAGLEVYDVKRCSLFEGRPITCGKECVERP